MDNEMAAPPFFHVSHCCAPRVDPQLDGAIATQQDVCVVAHVKTVRRKDASMAASREQDRDRIRRMSVRERMLLALELGRRGRAVQKRAQQGRIDATRRT